ncbi:hypothetical protein LCGC14_3056300 [marine sediment metagenome]|uniref:RNase H type-1 domain-containing protein n=1 Tax=marine sediment metagenome TaxID=412755 RepID=A0A0F8XWC7_9ZZZZ
MIKIQIFTDGENIADSLNDKDCTLQEVAVALLRLKQIEQILIDKEFDSKLVINQMFSFWRMRRGLYLELAYRAKELRGHFTDIIGKWIPREKNEICDKLAKDVLRNMKIKFKLQPE